MKKHLPFLVLVLILNFSSSCEVDDICTQEILTPKLIIGFYDATNTNNRKEVDTLSVWALGKDKLYTKNKTDSIAIPLDANTNFVNYILQSNSAIDTFEIHYSKKEILVSRSCGFKMNYTLSNESLLKKNWTNDFEIIEQNIENEQTIHVKIYH